MIAPTYHRAQLWAPARSRLETTITAALIGAGCCLGLGLALIDPPQPGSADLPGLLGLLKEWSIEFGNDVVVDASGMGQLFGGDASVPVVVTYPAHPITDAFRVMTAFPLARSAKAVEGGTKSAQPLLETSQQSWAETDLKSLSTGDVSFGRAMNAEAHRRLVQPLSALSLAAIPLVFLLSGEFNRRGQTRRPWPAGSCSRSFGDRFTVRLNETGMLASLT